MAILPDVTALGMGDKYEVLADANEGGRLRNSGALVGGGHFLEIVVVHGKQKTASNENRSQGSHKPIVFRAAAAVQVGSSCQCRTKQGKAVLPSSRDECPIGNVVTAQSLPGLQLTPSTPLQ